jgi:Lrp/AsnC family leucine-responsive transcriptional regulator
MLQTDPEISQVEISKRLGLTQPSISARLRKLKDSGAIALQAGMNLKKIGLHIAKIDLCIKSDTNKIIERFKNCPYCINGFITSGKFNLTLLFVCEDINTLEAIVDNSLRPLPEVVDLEFSIALAPIKDLIAPITSWHGTDTINGESPCGVSCKDCDMYATDRCLGCPATKEYKGNIWRRV